MANELPNLGADIILEFQQSINNVRLFGEAMDALDHRFGSIERRIESLRSSMNSLTNQVSRGTGNNLRREIERELNNLITANGVVVRQLGNAGIRISGETVRNVFNQAEAEINRLLATAYRNIVIEVNPSLQTGKIPIDKDEFAEINRAIARLVRVQLNNLVSALNRHGAGLISADDLSAVQFQIGKATVQQIVNKLKEHIRSIMLNPVVDSEATFNISSKDLSRVFTAIREKVDEAIKNSIREINREQRTETMSSDMMRLYNAVDASARQYISSVVRGINDVGGTIMTRPLNQVSVSLRRHLAKEMGVSLEEFNRSFANYRFTNQEIYSGELRRQFARLERALNRKIGGGLSQEVRQIVNAIERVEISYSPRLHQHLVREINRINNQIVKKIREQIDVQFAHMRAEISGVQVAPKDINRARRVREMGRVHYDESSRPAPEQRRSRPIANDPYARRDEYFNTFGLQGALINTFRHILAGSLVGTPLMLLYRSFEQYRTSQLEQLKMFANLFAKAEAESQIRAAQGDLRTSTEVAKEVVASIMPFVKEAATAYAIDYGQMTAIASVGSRLLDDAASVKVFTDVVGKIYSIDREGDPVNVIAPGLEAFMGQFGLHVTELERRVVAPLAVATNLTNATTEGVLNAIMRSGASFKAAGVSPEEAIAMVSASMMFTGLTGENIGNFYKTILPRLQSDTSLRQLNRLGVDVYYEEDGVQYVRSAVEIMREASEFLKRVEDQEVRNTVLSLFGMHQSAKGAATLNEMASAIEIIDAINAFDLDQLNELLTQNLGSPIVEMERAGVSAIEALTSIMEELTPVITTVSRGITNLSDKIEENSAFIGNLIQFLGSALLGYATVLGTRRLVGSNVVQSSVRRVEILDGMFGHAGYAGRGATQGILQGLADLPNIRRDVLEGSKANRAFVRGALEDPSLEPIFRDMAKMSDDRMKELRAYIHDNNLIIKDMRDLVFAVEESRGYRMQRALTDDERWGGTQYAARNLYRKDMVGIDRDFAESFAIELQDRQRFDQLSKTESGLRVTNFLAGLGDDDMVRFRKHIEDMHRTTGETIRDFDGLTRAVDSYKAAQQANIEQIRRTNPEMVVLGNNLDRVAGVMDGDRMRRGMKDFDAFLGGVGQKARAAISAVAGLATTVGRLGAQMYAFAALGEIISNVSYSMTTPSDQKEFDLAERELKFFQRAAMDLEKFETDSFRPIATRMEILGRTIVEKWVGNFDFLTGPFDSKYYDHRDRIRMLEEMMTYARDGLGLDSLMFQFPEDQAKMADDLLYMGSVERQFVKQLEEAGYTVEEFINQMQADLGEDSPIGRFRARQRQQYIKRFEEMSLEEDETRVLQEQLNRSLQKRLREEALRGSYAILDYDTLKTTLREEEERLESEVSLRQLRALLDGYATDSEHYVNLRRQHNEQVKQLYDEQLVMMAQHIEDLTALVARMREEGAPEEDILAQQTKLDNDLITYEIAQREFGMRSAQMEYDNLRLQYEAAMSRITRAAEQAEMDIVISKAVNEQIMDRTSREFIDSAISLSEERINNLMTQIEQMRSAVLTEEQRREQEIQIRQLEAQMEQERVAIRDLQITALGMYKQGLQDSLEELSVEYMQARVDLGVGGLDESNPILRQLRVSQYERQIDLFNERIEEFQKELQGTNDVERQNAIQREIRDLQRQSLQAQLGILEEMRDTGGTFNLPDNVRAMSYYEYITRNNSHMTYTVQGGDTYVTISMPNITDGTSLERVRDVGRALGEGLSEGRNLRLQQQANPFGYRSL